MTRLVPYIFCRYEISAAGELLDGSGQRQTVVENHGILVEHRSRGRAVPARVLFMEPMEAAVEERLILSFLVGLQPGVREKVGYDRRRGRRTKEVEHDSHIRAAHIVAVPSLNCMAVQDTYGDNNIPARTAIGAFRSLVRAFHEDGELDVTHISDAEVRKAIETWELIEYDYTVRPLNPLSLGDFANLRSEAMKQDNAAREIARVLPAEGRIMQARGGIISQTQEVVDAGYGQNGFRAVTPEGHEAHVPKAPFHMERERNLEERHKTRVLRMKFDADEERAALAVAVARSLVRFYGGE